MTPHGVFCSTKIWSAMHDAEIWCNLLLVSWGCCSPPRKYKGMVFAPSTPSLDLLGLCMGRDEDDEVLESASEKQAE